MLNTPIANFNQSSLADLDSTQFQGETVDRLLQSIEDYLTFASLKDLLILIGTSPSLPV